MTMSFAHLLELQTWLQAAISAPEQAPLQARAEHYLQSSESLDAAARLAIYQRSYRARLLQSFHAIFPGLLHALGHVALDAFALDFLQHSPPHTSSVNRVADGFAEYLHRTRPAFDSATGPDWTDFVIDLTRLELALLEVSEAAGLELTSASVPENVRQWSDAQLLRCQPRGVPCLRLLACHYPVHDYLRAVRADDSPRIPHARPTWLALTRLHYRLATRELAPVQWQLLSRLNGAITLAEVLETVTTLGFRPVPSLELARIWVGNFLVQGLVATAAPEQ
ncbi:MAG: DUF2063 domain-containing protein [Deltaproteobacteria bacterium]|nr:DUF2063 domain-containing protein [Deltaproteobacteria bacterium]